MVVKLKKLLKQLIPNCRENFIKALERENSLHKLDKSFEDIKIATMRCFIWEDTPQGSHYWSNINNYIKYKKIYW